MGLRPKEIAALERAGLPPGVVRYVVREAEGLSILRVLRIAKSLRAQAAMAALVVAIPILFRDGNLGWLGALGVILPLAAVILAALRNRALRRESPVQWSARQIAMAAVEPGAKEALKPHAARIEPGLTPRAALNAMARPDKDAAKPNWGHRLIIIGLVAVPVVGAIVFGYIALEGAR